MARRLVTVVALAAALVVAWQADAAPPVRASLYLAPNGDDAAACTVAAPCASLQRAFDVAAPGAVVQLASGTYPSQELSGDRGGLVTFTAAPGRGVTMAGRLTLAGVHGVKLDGFNFPRSDPQYELLLDSCNSDVTIANSTGRRFFILEGNSHITFDHGSWGGYSEPGDEDSAIGTSNGDGPGRVCDGTPAGPAHDIVFDHFTWHDVFWGKSVAQWGGSHPDCFELNGYVDGVTIRDSRFLRCQDSFFAIYPDQGDITNVTVRDTTFQNLGDTTWYGSQWVSDDKPHKCGNVVFTGNTWMPNNPRGQYPFSSIRANCVPPAGARPVRIVGNVFQAPPMPDDCARDVAAPYGTVWRDNVFLMSSPARPGCSS